MFKKFLLTAFIAGYIITPTVSNIVKADDTEVYFNDAGLLADANTVPNVLILLEWSSNTSGGNRLANMVTAFGNISDDPRFKGKVNLGVQAFYASGSTPSANVIRPVMGMDTKDSNGQDFDGFVTFLEGEDPGNGGPSLVSGMVEAARYFQGIDVNFGVPQSKSVFVTNPDAYIGNNIRTADYVNLLGSGGCGGNAIILISGGQATDNKGSRDAPNICSGCSSAADIASYLKSQKVDTYTVFSSTKSGGLYPNLQAISNASETGEALRWDGEAATLTDFIGGAIEEVLKQSTSFVQAGVTVSQQNRLQLDDHLYFSQFQPDNKQRWPGNLKKYRLVEDEDTEENILVDELGVAAVNDRGFFKNGDPDDDGGVISDSFWNPDYSADGNNVRLGGTAESLNSLLTTETYTLDSGDDIEKFVSFGRKVFSDFKVSADAPLQSIDDYTKNDFGIAEDDDWFLFKNKIKGLFISLIEEIENGTEDTDNPVVLDIHPVATVGSLGDPLHSVPKILRYSLGKDPGTGDELFKQVSFYSTNMGYLHAADISTGEEQWSYIPKEVLSNINDFYQNVSITNPEDHKYGMDGQIVMVHRDLDFDTVVDSNEKVFMIVGMRRGGDMYHVLDVTNLSQPKFKYKFSTKSDALSITEGQSWSAPRVGNIRYNGAIKTVMLLGGGYDKDRDDKVNIKTETVDGVEVETLTGISYNNKPANTKGNGLFIVDVTNGDILWSTKTATKTVSGSSSTVSMNDSFAGEVTPFGRTKESFIKHFYAADTGGNIYRVDISNDDANSSTNKVFAETNLLASVITDKNEEADNRRFFYSPTVAPIEAEDSAQFAAIALGSGYRAHPLDKTPSDFFYMYKDTSVYTGAKPEYISHANFTDVTDYIKPGTAAAAGIDIGKIPGWKIEMRSDGEKVLAEARIINNKIVFTSYVPTATKVDTCSVVIGAGSLYGVNVLDGSSFFDDETRSIENVYPGLSPSYQLVYIESGFVGLVGNNVIGNNDGDGLGEQLQSKLVEGLDDIKRMNWKKHSL